MRNIAEGVVNGEAEVTAVGFDFPVGVAEARLQGVYFPDLGHEILAFQLVTDESRVIFGKIGDAADDAVFLSVLIEHRYEFIGGIEREGAMEEDSSEILPQRLF
ncbi:unknown [Ruminococcus sp. CAG:382]|nr:unknown [Ruminococcus sp. CAG:382]